MKLTLSPTIVRDAVYVPAVQAQDGSWQPQVLIKRAVALLTDLANHLYPGSDATTKLEAEVAKLPKAPNGTAEEWLAVVRAWLELLKNFRISATPAEWAPTPAHGTPLWRNVLHYGKAPKKAPLAFTGGYILSAHLRVWVGGKKEPVTLLPDGDIDLSRWEGQELAIVRETPYELPATLGDLTRQETAQVVSRWLLLATMDTGGISGETAGPAAPQGFQIPTYTWRVSRMIQPGELVPEDMLEEVYLYCSSDSSLLAALPFRVFAGHAGEGRFFAITGQDGGFDWINTPVANSESMRSQTPWMAEWLMRSGHVAQVLCRDLRYRASNTGYAGLLGSRNYSGSSEDWNGCILPTYSVKSAEDMDRLGNIFTHAWGSGIAYREAIISARRAGFQDIPKYVEYGYVPPVADSQATQTHWGLAQYQAPGGYPVLCMARNVIFEESLPEPPV